MIGVVIFLFGIIRTTVYNYQDISVISGITYWGSLVYISAGSLSVAAQNKLHLCVIGILGIFLVFSILQFIISICISGFACKATYNRDSTVVNVALNQVNDLQHASL
ncbi:Membrane-spanning 4-domains subfamily A member 12 [Anabarilius grahami]|uniref:Membrane-spanning 4-domains subfamily A member 12 n=1 Tax=Anabarilius grahami TaxID=495550 RepID=A0A3N0Y176_ANAGA|nr:Membrane-spanning 4-domains subfamily A member 12 [Anabarilius grahami]